MAANAEVVIEAVAGDAGGEGAAPAPAATTTSDAAQATDKPQSGDAAATGEAQQQQQQQRVDQVPQAALHEARQENKTLKARIAQLEAQPRLTPEDASLLADLRATRAKKDEPEPADFLADPKAYVDTSVKGVIDKLEEQKKDTEQTKAQIREREEIEQVYRATASAEAEFVQQTPDYPQALQHLRQQIAAEVRVTYPEATDQQIANHVAWVERETARGLVAHGRNVPEFAYNLAKIRGYQPKQQTAPANSAKPDKEAARTMGSGGGDTPTVDDGDAGGMSAEFGQALQERFKQRKK